MLLMSLALGASLVASPGTDGPAPDGLAAYRNAKAQAGPGADAQVKLALWCEAHGLAAERMKHLAIAVLTDPKQATARGLLGLVEYAGKWQRPDAVSKTVQADQATTAALAEYNRRRAHAPETAEAQWRLAVWCDENGLKPEAAAHFTAVTRLQPGREAAWKRLGYRRHGDRWLTEAQSAAEKAEALDQKKADKHWTRQLAQWRAALQDPKRRAAAEAALEAVSDPRAVPAVWSVFGAGDAASQRRAVALLGRIDSADSSHALAALSVFGDDPETRKHAAETVKRRDPRDFVGWLVSLLRPELKYEVRPVGGPGSPGVLFVEGEQFNVRRTYTPPPLPDIALFPGEPVTFDPDGLPVVTRLLTTGSTRTKSYLMPTVTVTQVPIGRIMVEQQQAVANTEAQLEADLRQVNNQNGATREANGRVNQLLSEVTGHDEKPDREAWAAWWTDQQGYAYSPPVNDKPTLTENIAVGYTDRGSAILAQLGATPAPPTAHNACFKAGTSVKTLLGPRAIETVAVGDVLLTQDTVTGALRYEPVLAVFHNRPALTYRVDLGAEGISATGIHRFWKPGHGWVMARDLKPGDAVRTLNGPATVQGVEPETVVPVFNLEVAAGQSFFVGEAGALVHDNSLVAPVHAPFDATPEWATAPGATPAR